MSKEQNARILTDLLEYLKEQHSNLPTHVFEVLGEVIDDLKTKQKVMNKKKKKYLTPLGYQLEVIKKESPDEYKELMELLKTTKQQKVMTDEEDEWFEKVN